MTPKHPTRRKLRHARAAAAREPHRRGRRRTMAVPPMTAENTVFLPDQDDDYAEPDHYHLDNYGQPLLCADHDSDECAEALIEFSPGWLGLQGRV